MLEQADGAEKEQQAAAETASELDSAWNANKEQMLAEKAELEPEVERLRGIRSEEASEVSRTVLGLYDLLRERRGGRAVAKISAECARVAGSRCRCLSCRRHGAG